MVVKWPFLRHNLKKNFKSHKWPFYNHLWSLFCQYIDIFHKTEIQTVILRCLVCKNLNWIKSYNKILVKIFIFSCLKMHHFRGILPKWVLTPQRVNSSRVFKTAIFSKFFLTLKYFCLSFHAWVYTIIYEGTFPFVGWKN